MTALRIGAAVMSLFFLLCAAVQWNDPDPVVWLGVYGMAAGLAAAAAFGRLPLVPNALALAFFAGMTAAWAPSPSSVRVEAFTSFSMKSEADEEPREAMGLLLCTVWSAVQTAGAWRRR